MIALFEAHKAGLFSKKHILNNIVAGIIVGIVALPLAIAFATASGARPEQGLYTAIVAGFLTSVFGGTRAQISGPTGAFIVVLSAITAKHGIIGLQIATLMAGCMLLAMGIARLGPIIKYISTPVLIGFTAGIGVVIWVGQWKDFFGLRLPPPAVNIAEGTAPAVPHFHEKVWNLIQAFPTVDLHTTAIALLSLFLVFVTPKVIKRVPGSLVALIVATCLQWYFNFPSVSTLGNIPRDLPAFNPLPISFSTILELVGPAFAIAMLGAIESLLCAVVADGMAGTRHNSNQELIGQGIANIVSPLFGGFAATGAIARTAANIKNGATSPLAGIVHTLTLLLIMLIFAPLTKYIPLATLAAILFVVAYNMSEIHHFVDILKHAPRYDAALLVITFLLTVFTDLVIAVCIGVILAALIFMQRMSRSVRIEIQNEKELQKETVLKDPIILPSNTLIYSIDGPFFFGIAETFEQTVADTLPEVKRVILRLGRVPFIDATGIHTLKNIIKQFSNQRVQVILCEANPRVTQKLHRANVHKQVGEGCFVESLHKALNAKDSDLQA